MIDQPSNNEQDPLAAFNARWVNVLADNEPVSFDAEHSDDKPHQPSVPAQIPPVIVHRAENVVLYLHEPVTPANKGRLAASLKATVRAYSPKVGPLEVVTDRLTLDGREVEISGISMTVYQFARLYRYPELQKVCMVKITGFGATAAPKRFARGVKYTIAEDSVYLWRSGLVHYVNSPQEYLIPPSYMSQLEQLLKR